MTPAEYQYIAGFLKVRSGIVLSADKQYLVESRLNPIARRAGMKSLPELIESIRRNENSSLANDVIEAMTTNESFFFRDKTPFDNLSNSILPNLQKTRGGQKLRIWCAAASTGQEPYSIAMSIKEKGISFKNPVEIIGTDLSNEVLQKAQAGIYSQFEVQRGLAINLLMKYFKQKGDMWQIDSSLRSMVQYKQLNLLNNFGSLGKFDIIFCRNVLIYFDTETKRDILNRISSILAPDGYLLLGAAETVVGITDAFKPADGLRGCYSPAGAVAGSRRPGLLGASA